MLSALAAMVAGAVLAMAPPAAAAHHDDDDARLQRQPVDRGPGGDPHRDGRPGSTPTGQVDFADSGVLLGTATLNAGVATLVVSSLTVGDHALTATYFGDATTTPPSAR